MSAQPAGSDSLEGTLIETEDTLGGRTLKVHVSHPDAPVRKSAKHEDSSMDVDPPLMALLYRIESEVKKVGDKVDQSMHVAQEAKHAAIAAKTTASQTEKSLQDFKLVVAEDVQRLESNLDNTASQLDSLQTEVSKLKGGGKAGGLAASSSSATWLGSDSVRAGKSAGKGAPDVEKRSRTVYFGNFPEDTPGHVIVEFIEKWTKEFSASVQEIYSIGRIGERGAARFVNERAMWDFMTDQKGSLKFQALDSTIYVNTDSVHDPNPARTKSMRKLVRAIIEVHGGDGGKIKADIVTNYRKGKVWYRGERVAEWSEATDSMSFKPAGETYVDVFKKLISQE